MRISIPPGTEVKGRKGKYVVENIISISDRTTTVECRDSQNRKYRLKIFDGENSISKDSYYFFSEVKTRGLLPLVDFGEVSNNQFYVFNNYDVQSVDKQVISIDMLVQKIIPQVSYVISQVHSKRYLLRDLAREHILFDANIKEVMVIGLSNFVKVSDRATSTKELGYGQHYSYIAPEVEKYGYSPASDYFSLGTLLLSIIKGKNIIQDISQDQFYEGLKEGKVPGIDVNHLKNTPLDMYSFEDRVSYLIFGLLLPDPNQRWGYGEIKCWCNNQMIPLVQSGEKTIYQYAQPLSLDGKKCWNDKQISETISKNSKLWNKQIYKSICDYLRNQQSRKLGSIERFDHDDNDKSKIFKTIYTLYPAINGFAWNGVLYKDTQQLIEKIKGGTLNSSELQSILRSGCLSFFEELRSKHALADTVDIREIQIIEDIEKSSPGDGASRCILLFTPSKQARYFEVEGKKCGNVSDLLSAYKKDTTKLKDKSEQILKDSTFQAWLWAKGYEQMGNEAINNINANPKNAFPVLLTVLETCSINDEERKAVRETFVKYSDLAPIAWLFSNAKYYADKSKLNTSLYNRFNNTRIDLNKSVIELNQFLSSYVRDYQQFVQNTLKNPFMLEFGGEYISYDFEPMYETGFFCEKWNDLLDVCPAFLYSVNGNIDNKKIREWLSSCGEKQREVLKTKSRSIDTKDISGAYDYLNKCKRNLNSAIVMMIIATILMFIGFNYSVGFSLLSFAFAIIYPILSVTWYHQKKVRAEIWYRTYSQQADAITSINVLIRQVSERENDIYKRIANRNNSKCIIKSDNKSVNSISLEDPDALDLTIGQIMLAYLSTFGYVLLTTAVLGYVYSSFVTACLYACIYGIGAPYLFRKKKFINSCYEWTITTCIVAGISMFGGLAFGNTFLATMNWIPVVIVIVIIVFMIISSF